MKLEDVDVDLRALAKARRARRLETRRIRRYAWEGHGTGPHTLKQIYRVISCWSGEAGHEPR